MIEGPILPAGMPPGTEYASSDRAPDGVLYFRIYAGLFAFVNAMLVLGGGALMFAPLFTPPGVSSGDDMGFWIAGLIYGAGGLIFLVPTLIALFAGRRPWVHTLGTVVIALGMFHVCCIPALVPVLIVWMKPETRVWFGSR